MECGGTAAALRIARLASGTCKHSGHVIRKRRPCRRTHGRRRSASPLRMTWERVDSASMCGLTGLVAAEATSDELAGNVRRMCDALVHRGPTIRRMDRCRIGRCPRIPSTGDPRFVARGPSADGVAVRALYRHAQRRDLRFEELRRELRCSLARPFDTEVMLAAFDAWGVSRRCGDSPACSRSRWGSHAAPTSTHSRSYGREAALLRFHETPSCTRRS
jgi:hypothetical protein